VPLCDGRTHGQTPRPWLRCAKHSGKKGKRSTSANYRPVSLMVILCKILESLIWDTVIEHLDLDKLIKDAQHCFVKHKSCLTNLLVFMEEVTNYIDSGYTMDITYLDFQKAFSKVPHNNYYTN